MYKRLGIVPIIIYIAALIAAALLCGMYTVGSIDAVHCVCGVICTVLTASYVFARHMLNRGLLTNREFFKFVLIALLPGMLAVSVVILLI